MFHPSTRKTQYCGEPSSPRGSLLGRGPKARFISFHLQTRVSSLHSRIILYLLQLEVFSPLLKIVYLRQRNLLTPLWGSYFFVVTPMARYFFLYDHITVMGTCSLNTEMRSYKSMHPAPSGQTVRLPVADNWIGEDEEHAVQTKLHNAKKTNCLIFIIFWTECSLFHIRSSTHWQTNIYLFKSAKAKWGLLNSEIWNKKSEF